MVLKLVSGIILSALIALAQSGDGQRRDRPYPSGGPVQMDVLTIGATSLPKLVRAAHLIVDGTVTSVRPSSNTSTDDTKPLVETISIVAVNRVLSGKSSKGSSTIAITQLGGKTDKWDVKVTNDKLLLQEERYIFSYWRMIIIQLALIISAFHGIPFWGFGAEKRK